MEINSLQGSAAYTNAASAPPVDNTQLKEQNIEASRTELDSQSAAAVQDAYQVTLTREAQDLQNQEANEQQVQSQQAQTQGNEPEQAREYEASTIVNIVA